MNYIGATLNPKRSNVVLPQKHKCSMMYTFQKYALVISTFGLIGQIMSTHAEDIFFLVQS